MYELDLEVARWLTSPSGLAAVTEATRLLDDGTDELQALTTLRRSIPLVSRTSAVLAAAGARRRARGRWSAADALLFTREALEQASDPAVSRWRAQRFPDEEVHDLCSGVGGDALALARRARRVTAVDLDPARLVLLAHNAAVSGVEVDTVVGDALTVAPPKHQPVHVDPARRQDEQRRGDPRRTLPPVDRLLAAHRGAAGLAIVLAPGTDASDPALAGAGGTEPEVEYVQLGSDLVEAVAWYGSLRDGRSTASATVLERPEPGPSPSTDGVHLARAGERGPRLEVGAVGDLLVEVAPAAVRARLHDAIGATIGARRLAFRRALLTADAAVPASPWYRVRPVVDVLAWRPTTVRRWLAASDHGPVELVLHGVRIDPGEWWREVGRPPRGPEGIRIELVRRDTDTVAIVTRADRVG